MALGWVTVEVDGEGAARLGLARLDGIIFEK